MSEPTCRLLCEGVQAVLAVSEHTCRALCCRRAGCLSSVGTYLPGTVLQGCSLFKQCRNLPARHCVTGVHAVLGGVGTYLPGTVCRGAGCLSSVRTYLSGTVLQAVKAESKPACQALCCRGAGCLNRVGTYLQGTVAGMQAV